MSNARRQSSDTIEAILDAQIPIMTDWVDFPSVAAGVLITGATSNPTYGTVVTNRAQWRRVGSNMEIRYEYHQSSSGTAGSGTYLLNLPPGYTVDTTLVKANTGSAFTGNDFDSLVGNGVQTWDDGSLTCGVAVYSTTQLRMTQAVYYDSSAGTGRSHFAGATTPGYNFTAFYVGLKASVPILGWSATQTLREQLGL